MGTSKEYANKKPVIRIGCDNNRAGKTGSEDL